MSDNRQQGVCYQVIDTGFIGIIKGIEVHYKTSLSLFCIPLTRFFCSGHLFLITLTPLAYSNIRNN